MSGLPTLVHSIGPALVAAAVVAGCGGGGGDTTAASAPSRFASESLPRFASAKLMPTDFLGPEGPDSSPGTTVWGWCRCARFEGVTVDVYAGPVEEHEVDGTLYLYRRSASKTFLDDRTIQLKRTGAITLTDAPEGRHLSLPRVHNARLRFRTASGATGTLQMARDLDYATVTLDP